MNQSLSSLGRHFRQMRVAYAVLILSLVPAAIVYYRVRVSVETRARVRFDRIIHDKTRAIEQRIPRYLDEMFAVRALFAAVPSVSADQWQKYVADAKIKQSCPGIRALGYLERVNAGEKNFFLTRLRARAGADTRIVPEGDRPVYFPVVYVNQFDSDPHGAVTGDDHFAVPDRRAAMESARDAGQPMATGKVPSTTATSPGQNAALFFYLPVYRAGVPVATPAERQAALQGFIFMGLDPDRLLDGIFEGPESSVVSCNIYDDGLTPEHLLNNERPASLPSENQGHPLAQKVTVPVLNRTWTLHFTSTPLFEAGSERNLPLIALVCWLTLGFLLFGVTWTEVKARGRAERLAAHLRESELALAAEKEQLAVTLYSIADGVVTTDDAGCVFSLNKMAEQLTGWSQAEAIGKPLAKLFNVLHENTREPFPNPVEAVMRTDADSSLEKSALLIARNGTERAIAHTAAPIHDRQGGIIGVVVVFRDITERQKSEAELLKESKLESVGLLAGGIAHDFNNILQGILGNLSLARMNAHSTEKMLERLTGVEKSAMRARDLTQQLVMFARGGAPIRRQVQLLGVIKDATLFALTGSNVHCEFSLPSDLWPVEVDEGQFRQVLNNIVINATQAMPDGGKIEVRAENVEFTSGFLPPLKAGKFVKISIRDHGAGIRPEHLPRIFDPYFTTRTGARGLGLASAHSVIRKHDGQITVDTQLGKGSTFQIYLPASLKAVQAPASDTDQKRFFGQGRILVMDDEADILTLAGEMLKSMGYEVVVANDGAQAIERYLAAKSAGSPFAAVIMDLTVPEGMGGKECIRRLRELDPAVKAIVSSGYSYDPVMASFREFGFSGVIPKPYVVEELGRVLGEVIGKK